MAKKKAKKKPTLAERADRHDLYEQAVQDVESEIDFVVETWDSLRKRPLRKLREDFSGTCAAACEFVRRGRTNEAWGVDYDAEVLEWGADGVFLAFGVMSAGAVFGAFAFGRLSDLLGPKRALSVALVGWITVIIYLLMEPDFLALVIAGTVGGLMLGGTWSMNRHMVTRLSPQEKLGEIFGIEGFTERLSGVIGPIVFGALVVTFGYTPGLYLLLLLFVIGLILLQLVPGEVARPS
jgi:MFS-type transporter involved in bile tolerance (Atg22 family)